MHQIENNHSYPQFISAAAWQETPQTDPQRTLEGSYRSDIEAECVVLVFKNNFNLIVLYCAEKLASILIYCDVDCDDYIHPSDFFHTHRGTFLIL